MQLGTVRLKDLHVGDKFKTHESGMVYTVETAAGAGEDSTMQVGTTSLSTSLSEETEVIPA